MEKKEEEQGGRQSCIQARHFTICRSNSSVSSRCSGHYSHRHSSANYRNSISSGVYQQLSSSGILDLKDNREKEKREMQNLNERLADYIQKVHFQQARINNLEAENDALRSRKSQDFKPIWDDYDNELQQAHKVLLELRGSDGESKVKVIGLEDEIASQREIILKLESQAKDYRKTIETYGNKLGECEGELQTLRNRINFLEDENTKIRELLEQAKAHCRRLRSDLDVETIAHITADCLAQTKSEEAEFYRARIEQFELMKPEPILIKGMGYVDFWKSELAKCVREIQTTFDYKVDQMQQECEFKYSTQIEHLRCGFVRDDAQLSKLQEECKTLKSQIQQKNAAFTEATSKIVAIQSERDDLIYRMSELEREFDDLRFKYNRDCEARDEEHQRHLIQMNSLTATNVNLEMEISIYKKLLEGEEQRVGLVGSGVRSFVEQAIGVEGKEAANLKAVIQSSHEYMTSQQGNNKISYTGPIRFDYFDQNGGYIVIENDTSVYGAKSQSLKGWKLVKTSGGKTTCEVDLKDFELTAGSKYTVYAKVLKDSTRLDNEQIADVPTFGRESCIWKLLDEAGNEKSTLNANVVR
ncbi:retrograde protein of 51 kDa-like [Physella acuta]|uniref:retrograde protein of 51 kDa-like n=1 Tax=Physella acuta TaxID=109671 RepID=UPI0027DBD52E|nr:retrograde protein of 51 kDa-like [Physella acuta]